MGLCFSRTLRDCSDAGMMCSRGIQMESQLFVETIRYDRSCCCNDFSD